MTADCYELNPLQRSGTARDERTLRALLPSHVHLDERRVEDLIAFAREYAGLLAYYGSDNRLDGDWTPFVDSDPATLFARISRTRYRVVAETWEKYLARVERDRTPASYKPVFDIALSVFADIDELNVPSVFGTPFRSDLMREVEGRLAGDLVELLGHYRGGVSEGLVDAGVSVSSADEAYAFADAEEILERSFTELWGLGGPAPPDASIYGEAAWPAEERIDYSLAFVKSIFRRAYQGYIRLVTAAGRHLERSLADDAGHKPQNALFLAFLRLFSHAQENLNRFTERHLRFYFRQVLRLEEKPARPDAVHVLVDLARQADRHLIEAGTELKAGKGPGGRPLVYVVEDDAVVGRASVAGIKRIHVTGDGRVMDAPVADSSDGVGGELDEDNPRWRGFGSGPDAAGLRPSRIGFAVASPTLRLAEGRRTITLTVTLEASSLKGTVAPDDLADAFRVSLSGAEGWIPAPPVESADASEDNHARFDPTSRELTVQVVLGPDADPVVDYDAGMLGGGFDTAWPVMRVVLRQDPEAAAPAYGLLRGARVEEVGVGVDVDGVRGLILHGETGPLDPTQPFQPFGPRPRVGSTFRVGHHEALSKELEQLRLTFTWAGRPADFGAHYGYTDRNDDSKSYVAADSGDDFEARISVQAGGRVDKSLFDGGSEVQSFDLGSDAPGNAAPALEPFDTYELDATRGFVEFELTAPQEAFGHAAYARTYGKQVADIANGHADATLPNEPYTPTLRSVVLDYRASSAAVFGGGGGGGTGDRLFQLHPFGHAEVPTGASGPLLPPYEHTRDGTVEEIASILNLGVADAEVGGVVPLLFQVVEGSEDASVDPPTVVWSYLADGGWKPLDDELVSEGTGGLLRSGIVRVRMPDDAVEDGTRLPGGMRWLRLSVAGRDRGLPLMAAIEAQAVRATFDDRGNDPRHLASPLAPGSITGLVRSDSSVKKVRQPYPSAGGRMEERPEAFYTRVSERLRHKGRAVTIWDYERLVLEEFPEIYRAKCLNHTDDDTEKRPGAVRMVVIPDMREQIFGEKFRPTASAGLRGRIGDFLRAVCSTFVDLEVENPRYEGVRVGFRVAFREGRDAVFFQDRLQEDLDRFLAPWGFDRPEAIDFGGRLHQSTVVHFVENLPYVDYVSDFRLERVDDGGGSGSVQEVVASTSRSILTTAQGHHIDVPACTAT